MNLIPGWSAEDFAGLESCTRFGKGPREWRVQVDFLAWAGYRSSFVEEQHQLIVIDRFNEVIIKPGLL